MYAGCPGWQVTGATGGVGKRVVQLLRNKGLRVRALARNELKALAFLSGGQKPDPSSGLEVVVADIKDASTLKPALFKDVVAVVACTAAIVQPREGDSVDRSKYYQGIKVGAPSVRPCTVMARRLAEAVKLTGLPLLAACMDHG